MRSFTLSDCIKYTCSERVLENATCFGDVDNDGQNELIVGTVGGTLMIFKDSLNEPWKVRFFDD